MARSFLVDLPGVIPHCDFTQVPPTTQLMLVAFAVGVIDITYPRTFPRVDLKRLTSFFLVPAADRCCYLYCAKLQPLLIPYAGSPNVALLQAMLAVASA